MKFLRFGNELWEMSKMPPGLQLYTVRNELQQDFLGTLQKVADIGYKLVEFAGYGGISAPEMKKALDRLGLRTVSTYIGPDALENDLQNQIDYARTIGARYITTGYSARRLADDAGIREVIAALSKAGTEIKRQGLQLLYHPHAHEFEKRDGKMVLDRLIEGVGSDVLQLELDLYWAKKAGVDPMQALLTYKGISPLIHVKDIDKAGGFAELGRGLIDWPSIFRILKDVGVQYYFVEQDVSPNPFESVKISLNYLKSIGVA